MNSVSRLASAPAGEAPSPAGAPLGTHGVFRSWMAIPVVVLLLIYWGLAVSAAREKSATFDEPGFLAGGYSYWAFHDYRVASFEGQLPQRVVALPLLASKPNFPDIRHEDWTDAWAVGHDFLYRIGNDAEVLLSRSRAAAGLLSAFLGLLVFLWSRRLFGYAGGLVSLVLFAFCPTMLANGPLLKADMASALFFTASTGCLWGLFHRISFVRVTASCLVLAGLFLAKLTAILIVPIAGVLVVIRLLAHRPLPVAVSGHQEIHSRWQQGLFFAGLAAVHALVVWVIVWGAFGFRFSALNRPSESEAQTFAQDFEDHLSKAGSAAPLLRQLHDWQLLPEAYLYGLTFQTEAMHQGREAFLNGEVRPTGGFLAFFPYCWLVKTPLPLFGVLALAGWGFFRAWRRGQSADSGLLVPRFYDLMPLFVLLAIQWIALLAGGINIGHRYLAPVYPPIFILAGGGALCFSSPSRGISRGVRGSLVPATLVLLLFAFVAESLARWPDYLAYFNLLAGGPRHGYRHLVDSSLDWGQDLPGLQRWLQQNVRPADRDSVYLAYFGTASVSHYRIRAHYLASSPPQQWGHRWSPLHSGIYCISATLLQMHGRTRPWTEEREANFRKIQTLLARLAQSRNNTTDREKLFQEVPKDRWPEIYQQFQMLSFDKLCTALGDREPDDEVGYSILIYRLRKDEIDRALNGSITAGNSTPVRQGDPSP
ncbi:MAG TPA: hypothetical protein VE999_15770 [Gemmataceae bacterium]|nr:hypothetical protein [Gemmataceae bacterium]